MPCRRLSASGSQHRCLILIVLRYMRLYQNAALRLLLDGYFVRELKDESPIHLHPHVGIDLKPLMEDRFDASLFFARARPAVVL